MLVGDAWVYACKLYTKLGQFDQALDAAAQALTIRERLLGPKHLLVADARFNVGLVHLRLGSAEEALNTFIMALQLHSGQDSQQRIELEYGAAMAQHQAGNYSAARISYDSALETCLAVYGKEHELYSEIEMCVAALEEDAM
eukprot:TRINITY_DN6652_c0_g2_i18.p1 TRINITY_DN6652_c0_g2~~TRINITY_DN6652_c0_g2_i18.p1  ORF type:complete len:142 (-),score=49.98 TRINITY_DN6652_c0_g2_i18:218-643(-)